MAAKILPFLACVFLVVAEPPTGYDYPRPQAKQASFDVLLGGGGDGGGGHVQTAPSFTSYQAPQVQYSAVEFSQPAPIVQSFSSYVAPQQQQVVQQYSAPQEQHHFVQQQHHVAQQYSAPVQHHFVAQQYSAPVQHEFVAQQYSAPVQQEFVSQQYSAPVQREFVAQQQYTAPQVQQYVAPAQTYSAGSYFNGGQSTGGGFDVTSFGGGKPSVEYGPPVSTYVPQTLPRRPSVEYGTPF